LIFDTIGLPNKDNVVSWGNASLVITSFRLFAYYEELFSDLGKFG
jgi:hypothetical protein